MSIATGVLPWPGNICICVICQWIHTIHLDLVIACSVIRQWLLTVHLDLVLVWRAIYQLDTDGSSWPGNSWRVYTSIKYWRVALIGNIMACYISIRYWRFTLTWHYYGVLYLNWILMVPLDLEISWRVIFQLNTGCSLWTGNIMVCFM